MHIANMFHVAGEAEFLAGEAFSNGYTLAHTSTRWRVMPIPGGCSYFLAGIQLLSIVPQQEWRDSIDEVVSAGG